MTLHNPHYPDVPAWMRLSDAPVKKTFQNQLTVPHDTKRPEHNPSYWKWTSTHGQLSRVFVSGSRSAIINWKDGDPGPYRIKSKKTWWWVWEFDQEPTKEQLTEVMNRFPVSHKKRTVYSVFNEYEAIRWGLGLVKANKIVDLATVAHADQKTIYKALTGGVCSGLSVRKNGGQWSRMKLFRRDDGEYFHSAEAAAHSVEGAVARLCTHAAAGTLYKGFVFKIVEVPGDRALRVINNGGRDPQEE